MVHLDLVMSLPSTAALAYSSTTTMAATFAVTPSQATPITTNVATLNCFAASVPTAHMIPT
jgi:hypothetical protein